MKIKLVIATRESQHTFFTHTPTGRSLSVYRPPMVEVHLFCNNDQGLSTVYNQVIQNSRDDPALLVFAHDDLFISDYFWPERIKKGLTHFDVVGLAGNLRRLPEQPSWLFVNSQGQWDEPRYLSGIVAHGDSWESSKLSFYGPVGQAVKLLDGLLLAVHSQTLLENNILFDERFAFHFYDLDFCRQVEQKGLTCGTIDLPVVHKSAGNYASSAFPESYKAYLDKWKE